VIEPEPKQLEYQLMPHCSLLPILQAIYIDLSLPLALSSVKLVTDHKSCLILFVYRCKDIVEVVSPKFVERDRETKSRKITTNRQRISHGTLINLPWKLITNRLPFIPVPAVKSSNYKSMQEIEFSQKLCIY
jgi:hypothetical protein